MEKGDEIGELRCRTPFCESYRIARNFCVRKRIHITKDPRYPFWDMERRHIPEEWITQLHRCENLKTLK
jgi:hypothetical protein